MFGAGVMTAAVLLGHGRQLPCPPMARCGVADAVAQANLVNGTHYVPKAVLTEFKQAIRTRPPVAAGGDQPEHGDPVRMNLGPTTPSLDLSFDMGVPGSLNLGLATALASHLNWDLYLGFGVGLTDGFCVVTNMPNAGVGQVTPTAPASQENVATGVADNARDATIDNLAGPASPARPPPS